ncbi:uncharacterized protein [Prorops nasuta]|uniref:uncharacterized protein n=1 Tax=Prorops nasuta TaxID=863751 RepID=UPI0034CDABE3
MTLVKRSNFVHIRYKQNTKKINEVSSRFLKRYKDIVIGIFSIGSCWFLDHVINATECIKMYRQQQHRHSSSRTDSRRNISFSGDYLEWNNFYETFSSIVHEKAYVSGRDKFHYLKSCLQGEAATVITSLAITSENYEIAWDTLISQVPTLRGDNFKVLKEVRDSVTVALNALKTMGYGVDHWDPIIVHSLKNKLDDTLRLAWEMYLGSSKDYPTFLQFSEFLTRHINSLQSLGNKPKTSKKESGKSLKSHAASVNSTGCAHCGSNHLLYQCKDYLALTPQARSKFAFSQNLCINCLRPGHSCSNCSSSSRCRKCSKMHHTLLHFDKSGTGGSKSRGTTPATNSASEPEPSSSHSTTHLSVTDTRSVLLATFSARIDAHDGSRVIVRSLVDPGSETSFISEKLAQQLRVPRQRINATIHGVNSVQTVRAEAQITLHSLKRPGASLDVTAIILSKITPYLPPSYSPSSIPALNGIELADTFASTKVPIDVLLGADYLAEVVEGPYIRCPDHSVLAQQTIFGWIVAGVLSKAGRSHSYTVHHCFDFENTLRDFWELEEVPEVKPMSTEDSLSEKTLSRILRRLDTSPEQAESYSQFLQEYLMLGHMSPVPRNSDFRVFLPHHAVFKTENQKTKIRVVFNASSKTSTGVSLNDTLFIGPKLQQDITRILMNWRSFRYLMQSTWLLKLSWDEEIPEPIKSKWLKCYEHLRDLQTLRIPRPKWQNSNSEFGEGDLVLVKVPNNPPRMWTLGRILKLVAGVDGVARVAVLKTARKEIQRRSIFTLLSGILGLFRLSSLLLKLPGTLQVTTSSLGRPGTLQVVLFPVPNLQEHFMISAMSFLPKLPRYLLSLRTHHLPFLVQRD